MFSFKTALQSVARRGFASAAAASSGNVQVPLALHGIEGRYATALFTAAAKANQLDTVESEVKRIASVVKKDDKIKAFLENPVLSRDQKSSGVNQLMEKYSPLTKNFFLLLADNRRLNETTAIINSFLQLTAAQRGEVTVTVTTAKALDSKLESQLKTVLSRSKALKNSKNLKIVSKVNESILGGMIVEVGDKSIDLSISSRVAKLNKALTDSI